MKFVLLTLLATAALFVNAQDGDDCPLTPVFKCVAKGEAGECSIQQRCSVSQLKQGIGIEKCGSQTCEYPFVCGQGTDAACKNLDRLRAACESGGRCYPRRTPCGQDKVCEGDAICTKRTSCDNGKPFDTTDYTEEDLPEGCALEYTCINVGSSGPIGQGEKCGNVRCRADEVCRNDFPSCAEYQQQQERCSQIGCFQLSGESQAASVHPCNQGACNDQGVSCGDTVCKVGEECKLEKVRDCDALAPSNGKPTVSNPTDAVSSRSKASTGFHQFVDRESIRGKVFTVTGKDKGTAETKLKSKTKDKEAEAEIKSGLEYFKKIKFNETETDSSGSPGKDSYLDIITINKDKAVRDRKRLGQKNLRRRRRKQSRL